jgi:hypothetical protein
VADLQVSVSRLGRLAHRDRTVGPLELVSVSIPGGGELEALRFQDMPAEHVIAFMGLPPGLKEAMGARLFMLAAGPSGADLVAGMTFGELEHVLSEWLFASAESEAGDSDGRGAGIDWSGLLL